MSREQLLELEDEKGTFSTGISHETGVPAYVASGIRA